MLQAAVGELVAFGQGKALRCQKIEDVPKNVNRLLGCSRAVLASPDSVYGPHVCVNAFRPVDATDSRLVVHLVNYNVPLGVDAPGPLSQDDLVLSISLPDRFRATGAKTYAPGEVQAVDLSVVTVNGRAEGILPRLEIYRVVEVVFAK